MAINRVMKYMLRRQQIDKRSMSRVTNFMVMNNSKKKQFTIRLIMLVFRTTNQRLSISIDNTKTCMHKNIKANHNKRHSLINGELPYLTNINNIQTIEWKHKGNKKLERITNSTPKTIINDKMTAHTSSMRRISFLKRNIINIKMMLDQMKIMTSFTNHTIINRLNKMIKKKKTFNYTTNLIPTTHKPSQSKNNKQ